MDIGTLTGTLELDDRLTSQFETVLHSVESFSSRILDELGLIGIAATVAATAITGVTYTIIELGKQGSRMADVEAGFHRLAGGVERAHEIMKEMQKGTAGTVDDLLLMTQANKLLQAGFKGTAEDFGTLTSVSRVLSREGFGPLETILSQVDRAMQTGMVARLGRIGLTVNVKKAEEELAKSLHVTVQELSPLGVLEAKRIAVLEASRKAVADAGVQEMSFAEQITSTTTAVEDWIDELKMSIGTSSHVIDAYKAIKDAVVNAIGSPETAAERILTWVNDFADAAKTYGPKIVGLFVDTFTAIDKVYNAVTSMWNAIPQWIKDIGVEAGIATVATYALAGGLTKIGEASILGSILGAGRGVAGIAKVIKDYGSALLGLGAAGAVRTVLYDIAGALRTAGVAAWEAMGPLVLIPIAIVAIYEAWKHWDTISIWIEKATMWLAGYSKAQIDARIATLEHNKALEEQAKNFKDIQTSAAMAGMIKPSLTPLAELLQRAPKLGAEGPGIFKGGTIELGPTAIPEAPELTQPGEAEKAHTKAVKDLLEALRTGDKEVKVFHEVFSKLTEAERADINVQSQLIPMYIKGAEARQQMTAAESAWYAQALRTRELDQLRQEQSLAFRHITLDTIDARKLSGQSEQEIAAQFHVTADALKDYEDRLIFARNEHKNLADVVKMSSAEYASYRQYVQLAKEEQQAFNIAVVTGIPVLQNYDSQLLRARETLDFARRDAEIKAHNDLVLQTLKSQGTAELSLAENQVKYDELRHASAQRIFIDSQNVERIRFENARREAEQQFQFQDKTVAGYSDMTEAHKIALDQMDRDFASSNALRIATYERQQSKFYQMLDSIGSRVKTLGQNVESNFAGIFFGLGDDIDGHLHAAAKRAHDAYVQIAADGKHTASELANAFRAWRDAEDAANSSLAERIKSVWYDVKKTIIDVLNDILKYFTERFLVGLIKGMAGAKLGENFGSALMGGGGGGLGSLANTGLNVATGGRGSLLGSLLSLGGGAGVATTGTGAAAALGTSAGVAAGVGAGAVVVPPTFLAAAPALGATGGGVITGSSAVPAAAGGGGALGFLSSPAFWTNPFTIAAAAGTVLTLGIIKKGWFRGGEEGVKVNPAKDKFLSQFAQYDPPEIHDSRNPPGFHGLAAQLALTHGSSLFDAFTKTHTMKDFQFVEQKIAQHLAGRHIGPDGQELPRIASIKLYEKGGFVQPGLTQPAVLHGGGLGELVGPIQLVSKMIADELRTEPENVAPAIDRLAQHWNPRVDATGFGIRPQPLDIPTPTVSFTNSLSPRFNVPEVNVPQPSVRFTNRLNVPEMPRPYVNLMPSLTATARPMVSVTTATGTPRVAPVGEVRFLQQGGFIAPGATQPAVLHGGGLGELVGPVQILSKMISTELRTQMMSSERTTSFTNRLSSSSPIPTSQFFGQPITSVSIPPLGVPAPTIVNMSPSAPAQISSRIGVPASRPQVEPRFVGIPATPQVVMAPAPRVSNIQIQGLEGITSSFSRVASSIATIATTQPRIVGRTGEPIFRLLGAQPATPPPTSPAEGDWRFGGADRRIVDNPAALQAMRTTRSSNTSPPVNNHLWHIEIHGGVMDRTNVRQIFKEHIIPLHKQANLIDEDGYAESTKRAVY